MTGNSFERARVKKALRDPQNTALPRPAQKVAQTRQISVKSALPMGPKSSESREIACKLALRKGPKAAEYEKTCEEEKKRRPSSYMGSGGGPKARPTKREPWAVALTWKSLAPQRLSQNCSLEFFHLLLPPKGYSSGKSRSGHPLPHPRFTATHAQAPPGLS